MKVKLLHYEAPEIKVKDLSEEDVITASYGKLMDWNDDTSGFSFQWL